MFVPLKSILPQAVKRTGTRPDFEAREIGLVYRRVVEKVLNKKAAMNSRALFLRNKILIIEASSSVWACQLQFIQHSIIERINALAGKEIIARISFRVK